MEITEFIINQVEEDLNKFLNETVNGELLLHPNLELLKTVYRNGFIDGYERGYHLIEKAERGE